MVPSIHIKDHSLIAWLLEDDVDTDSLCVSYEIDTGILRSWESSSPVTRHDRSRDPLIYVFPSLLALAAEHDDLGLMQTLIDRGVESLDSEALLKAVKCGANQDTVCFLLELSEKITPHSRGPYGLTTLCHTIHKRDYTMVNLLAGRVGINKRSSWKSLNPLGVAVAASGATAAGILLNNGADSNALVARDGMTLKHYEDSVLWRLSPLLGAIDTGDLSMIKLLIVHEAEVDYLPNQGLMRTPLQRAAENGHFEVVKYLLDRDVKVDQVPCYNGGTELQFAAIGGYVGIATLLVEHGADVNYAPARGHGRTAFEGAAQWGRLDMVLFLVQAGDDLSLQFGTDGETQGERAVRFARSSGHLALSRFMQKLCDQRM